ncbi:MAG: ABC transporter ATP-binding protein [Burkholderiales bacterium]|nr:ABC transporter ATP-binding protein [Burkholderiales bacterium]
MSHPLAIKATGLGKRYRLFEKPSHRLLRLLLPAGTGPAPRDFWALRDVSFEVERGSALGVLGRNGSGKSTLLQMLAGTLTPTEGTMEVNGRVAALLELGSGFNPEFSGRENVYLNGAILGFTRAEMDERFDAIAAFADIGDFIDQPVKTYSSGMMLRLAFAVQVQVQPDILIVDEALAVGDSLFQKRCFERMNKLLADGTTLLFVSHDAEAVRTLTSQAILLRDGHVRAAGPSADVILEYRRQMHDDERQWLSHLAGRAQAEAAAAAPAARAGERAYGDLDAEVLGVRITDASGAECNAFHPGDRVNVAVRVRCHRDLTRLNVGLRLRNKEGVKIYSWGTLNQDMAVAAGLSAGDDFWSRRFAAGEEFEVGFGFDCALGTNFYEVQASVSEEGDRFYGAQRMLHWVDEAAFFHVTQRFREYFFGGVADLRMEARLPGRG